MLEVCRKRDPIGALKTCRELAAVRMKSVAKTQKVKMVCTRKASATLIQYNVHPNLELCIMFTERGLIPRRVPTFRWSMAVVA